MPKGDLVDLKTATAINDVLVEQAAEAFLLWRGVRPPSAQVLREMQQSATA